MWDSSDVAKFEQELIRERVHFRLANAKVKGKPLGVVTALLSCTANRVYTYTILKSLFEAEYLNHYIVVSIENVLYKVGYGYSESFNRL